MAKLYQYVGPAAIRDHARHQPPGFEARSLSGLMAWLQARGAARGYEVTVTFVVDEAGSLRVADRHTEHVACAGGGPVRSAGEMTLAIRGERVRVTASSNQSTGFCPEPSSWGSVQEALEGLGVEHPEAFTHAFDFRRCPSCGQTNLIKDGIFVCDGCDEQLPRAWNYQG